MSTIQNTRRASRYGGWVMTWATSGRTARCRWSARSGQRPWRDARPARPGRPTRRRARIRARRGRHGAARGGRVGCVRRRAWMLVFSSAQSTNSSRRSVCPPSAWRTDRGCARPCAAKSGSRGKIQLRCCQGRMASSCNQRQTVVSLMRATMPQRCASRTMSALLKRDSGRPRGGRKLTREGLDLDDHLWGERPGGGPGAGALRGPAGVHGRSACATGSRHRGRRRARRRSRHWGRPAAASRIILARSTSKYGNVYLRARLSRISRSLRERDGS